MGRKPPRMAHVELIKALKDRAKDGTLLNFMKSMDVEVIVSNGIPLGHAKVIVNRALQTSNSKLDAIYKDRVETRGIIDKESLKNTMSNAMSNTVSVTDFALKVAAGIRLAVEAYEKEEKEGGKKSGLDDVKETVDKFSGVSEQLNDAIFKSWESTLTSTYHALRMVEERIIPADQRGLVPLMASKGARSASGNGGSSTVNGSATGNDGKGGNSTGNGTASGIGGRGGSSTGNDTASGNGGKCGTSTGNGTAAGDGAKGGSSSPGNGGGASGNVGGKGGSSTPGTGNGGNGGGSFD